MAHKRHQRLIDKLAAAQHRAAHLRQHLTGAVKARGDRLPQLATARQPAGDEPGVKGVAAAGAIDHRLKRRHGEVLDAGRGRAGDRPGAVGDDKRGARLRRDAAHGACVERLGVQAEVRAQLLAVEKDDVGVRAHGIVGVAGELDRDAEAAVVRGPQAVKSGRIDRRAEVQMVGARDDGKGRLGRTPTPQPGLAEGDDALVGADHPAAGA